MPVDLDLELTVIDSKLDPTEAYDVGSNVTQLASVAQKGGASLESMTRSPPGRMAGWL